MKTCHTAPLKCNWNTWVQKITPSKPIPTTTFSKAQITIKIFNQDKHNQLQP